MVKDSEADWLTAALAPPERARLDAYATLLLAANRRAGLVSAGTGREAVYRRHFAESLALLSALEARSLLTPPVIDIGSGGGFPGLVIAIAKPGLRVTLLEASQKKASFLAAAARDLGLANVRVLGLRAEDAAHDPAEREAYALATARAVAPLAVLLEYAIPFLQPGGVLAALKGSGARRELAEAADALAELHGEVIETCVLPAATAAPRPPVLVLVRKTAPTPGRYPRRAGIPAKRPLRVRFGLTRGGAGAENVASPDE